MMEHAPGCAWQRTTLAECEYRETHHYCPHPEHACTCFPAEAQHAPLDFSHLRDVNITRLKRWHEEVDWLSSDWSNAMCGECGEAANIVKKLRRWETGVGDRQRPPDELVRELAHELADTVIYVDILADFYGIDLGAAIVEKFNITSEKRGFPERLAPEAAR